MNEMLWSSKGFSVNNIYDQIRQPTDMQSKYDQFNYEMAMTLCAENLRRKNSLLNQTFDNVLVSSGCWQFALKVYLCCKLCSWRGSVGSKGGTNIPSFFWPLLTRQFNRKLDLGWNHFSDKDCILKMTKNTLLWVSQKLAQNNKVLLFHLALNKLEIKVQMAPRQSVGWG